MKNLFLKNLIFTISFSSIISLNSVAYAGGGDKEEDGSVILRLSPTRIPREENQKNFSKNFTYSWKIKTTKIEPEGIGSRQYLETLPFINIVGLLLRDPDFPEENQRSVRFSKADINEVLELYTLGKLYLSWCCSGMSISQYCINPEDGFHTLAVTPERKNITYYKQQRYVDNTFSDLCHVFYDSKYRAEYWFDESKEFWVIEDPDKGIVTFQTRKKAIKALKQIKSKDHDESNPQPIFNDPYSNWLLQYNQELSDESSSPSLLLTGFFGWLILTSNIIDGFVNKAPTFPLGDKPENPKDNFQDGFEFSPVFSVGIHNPILVSLFLSRHMNFERPSLYTPLFVLGSLLFPTVKGSESNSSSYSQITQNTNEKSITCYPEHDERYKSNPIKCNNINPDNAALDKGEIRYVPNNLNKEIEQVISESRSSRVEGDSRFENHNILTLRCDKEQRHHTWTFDDEKLEAREIFEVWAVRKGEEPRKTDILEEATYSTKYLEDEIVCSQPTFTFSEHSVPSTVTCRLDRLYIRPDKTILTRIGETRTELLQKKHIRFVHDVNVGHSYQVIKGYINVGKRIISIPEEFHIKSKHFNHRKKHHTWFDDKVNHFSERDVTIFIEPHKEGEAIDQTNISHQDQIVDVSKKREDHLPLWWVSPHIPIFNNYEIQHSKERYK